MATEPRTTGLTYEALWTFPEDQMRREIIGGELFVTPPPSWRHQKVAGEVFFRLRLWTRDNGGTVLPAPMGVYLTDADFVEPDAVFLSAENLSKIEEQFIRSAPDIVVEVSSPSTRNTDLGRKKDLYERFGVPEYWFVDLESDRIEVYRLEGGRFASPVILGRGEILETSVLSGFSVPVEELLGPPEE